uniref:TRAF3-interacting protein 1 n=1 Tax=Syphacia muris TaxID=451379 RepID=A0A0N5AI01_9BILA
MSAEKTRELLQPLISRPVLTDQLLERPPFRFILDIVIEVINSTNFLKDVFTADELDITKMINRETKSAFIRKLIHVLNTDASLDNVKVGKILAGKEADLTNLLLQKLGSDASQFLLQRRNEEMEKRRKENKTVTSIGNEAKSKKHRKADDSKEGSKKKNETKEGVEAKKERQHHSEQRHSSSKKSTTHHTAEEHKKNKKHHSRDKSPAKKREETAKVDKTESVKTKTKHHRNEISTKDNKKDENCGNGEKVLENNVPEKCDLKTNQVDNVSTIANHAKDSATGEAEKVATNNVDNESNETEISLPLPSEPKQQKTVSAPVPFATQPHVSLERPGTAVARTAPPKLKKRQIAEVEVKLENVKEEAPVILNEKKEDDEADFVIDDVGALREQPYLGTDAAQLDAKDHGVLVKKILKTKEELEAGLDSYFSPTVYDEEQRNQIEVEITDMQKTVQRLTQALHPLARLFDYVQEDVDNMVQEMNDWRLEKQNIDTEANKANVKINLETEKLLMTLKKLDEEINEKRSAIARIRANIIENDNNISKLLNNM